MKNIINPDDKPVLSSEIFISDINQKYKNKFCIYVPKSIGGILIVDKTTLRILRDCNGDLSIKDLSKKYGVDLQEMIESFKNLKLRSIIEGGNFITKESTIDKLDCWVHITNDCNLRCTYCYIHKNRIDMSLELAYELVDKMINSCKERNIKNLQLRFAGGEPLLRLDLIKKIISYANTLEPNIKKNYIILTNATLITNSIASYLFENNVNVSVSLDGIGHNNDKTRIFSDGTGSFKKTMKGIETLKRHGINPKIMIVVSSTNLIGLPELTKFMIENDMIFRYSLEKNTQTGMPSVLNNKKQLISILKECYNIMDNAILSGKTSFICQFCDITFSYPKISNCAAWRHSFACGSNGDIATCGLGLETPICKLKDVNNFFEEFKTKNSEFLSANVSKIDECKKCIWRNACSNTCSLQNYATYKDHNHLSIYCEIYKEILPFVLKNKALKMCVLNDKVKEIKEKGGDINVDNK